MYGLEGRKQEGNEYSYTIPFRYLEGERRTISKELFILFQLHIGRNLLTDEKLTVSQSWHEAFHIDERTLGNKEICLEVLL